MSSIYDMHNLSLHCSRNLNSKVGDTSCQGHANLNTSANTTAPQPSPNPNPNIEVTTSNEPVPLA